MTKLMLHDQAMGLRKLPSFQAPDSARVFTIAGGKSRIGKTSIVVNLAVALARKGRRVLLIDENPCHNNICTNLGLRARFDLLHVIYKDKKLNQVLLQGPENIAILSAMRGIHALNKLNPLEQDWLVRSFSELTHSVDIVLIDTAIAGTTHVLPLSLASEQVMMVISGSAASLTGAYVLIKIMSQEYTRRHFLILVNKAGSEAESFAIYQNFYKVARQYLSVTLEYAGYIPNDERLRSSTQLCKPVLETYPSSQAAICFGQVVQNILRSSCPDKYHGGIDNFIQRLIQTSHLSMANFMV
ncbi:flagellar biosynthesis protein FlhG [Nitrosomonas ureae]|uniref:Flagellar biosynthesis protein FlhG n=1 Tax=Nitrosomonas ureae TaxID=44577 RepID=A0A285BUK9_9PROT|nr:AAA family ATPase [Nitrosomonas ureae]SNX58543.1 flagellar biosynthesis protein FlhG [Nitrosomonas ureae]